MATREEIEAARQRIESARDRLAEERARRAELARDVETDIVLARLVEEEDRLNAEIRTVQEDAAHQERANAKRRGEPVEDVTPAPTLASQDVLLSDQPLPFPETNGDPVTGKE